LSIVGYGTLPVMPEVKNLRAQLERQTAGDFAAAGRKGGQQMGDAAGQEAAGRIRTHFGGLARELAAPLAAGVAGAGIIEGFKSVIGSASDAQQAVGGVRSVFKDYADGVVQDADRADQALGLSATQYEELVTISGALLKNKGLKDFADQGRNLIQIGADLSATYGGSTKDAVEALNAALRGESDPIERYAISLNETAVNAVLAANGQSKLTGAALEQAKTQARLQLITQQSADAQGDFAREADTAAGASQRANAQWANMRAELGDHLLPATTKFIGFMNSDALPTLEATGGVVGTAVHFFSELPAPVQAATGALVAFRAARALGLGRGADAGGALITRGLEDIRIRAMLVTDEYHRLRQQQVDVLAGFGRSTPAAGRLASALGAIELGAIGAGRGIKAGLSGALGLVGGPWGAAFIAGTAIVAHFWQEHQHAKQKVEDFTATLDKETGAMTSNTREWAVKQLLDDGALKSAQRLGVSLQTVTDAALGQKDAIATLTAQIGAKGQLDTQAAADAIKVKESIEDQNGTVQKGIANQKLFTAALDGTTTTQADGLPVQAQANRATEIYVSGLDKAKDAVRALLDVENKRRNANLTIRQDRLALIEQLQAAREEAAKGGRTLDENTKAGQENQQALFDLASQWNNSAMSVKNAKGAYEDFRHQFIDVATSMGDTIPQARKLANEILNIPRRVDTDVKTPGMKQALHDLAELRAQLAAIHNFKGERFTFSVQARKNQAALSDIHKAGGGLLQGPGSATSDSILMWGSNGEFMQRKAAVDYYGLDYMRAINALQVPRYAGGGPVGSTPVATGRDSSAVGHEIVGHLTWDRDGMLGLRGVIRDEISKNENHREQLRRSAAIGGVNTGHL
jgi:hypothetical protein